MSDDMTPREDSIPTETAAKNIAKEMNNAYAQGYRAAQYNIKAALGALR